MEESAQPLLWRLTNELFKPQATNTTQLLVDFAKMPVFYCDPQNGGKISKAAPNFKCMCSIILFLFLFFFYSLFYALFYIFIDLF
jgi:hypothetical protein